MNQNEKINPIKIAIIGTGISGLYSSLCLLKEKNLHIDQIDFYDKDSNIGGVLQSTKHDGFMLEHGAQGVLYSRKTFRDLISDLKIEDKVILPKKEDKARYLIKNKKCIPIHNIFKLFRYQLLNFKIILLLFLDLFRQKQILSLAHQSLYDFFEKRFGTKFADNFIVPFSFGIWGGASRQLLIRYILPKIVTLAYESGSLIRPLLLSILQPKKMENKTQGLVSFSEGMYFFISSIKNEIKKKSEDKGCRINFNMQTDVNTILKKDTLWTINSITEDKINYDAVIFAAQPWHTKTFKIESNHQNNLDLGIISSIPTHNIAVIGIGGKKDSKHFYPKGFGALAENTSKDLLGIIFVHSTYKAHVPEDSFLYRVMIGGDREIDVSKLNEDELILIAKKHLNELALISGNEELSFQKVLVWNNTVPIATSHQDKVIEAIWRLENFNQGLFFTGNYISGVSVNDCLDNAQATAKKISKFIFYKTFKHQENVSPTL